MSGSRRSTVDRYHSDRYARGYVRPAAKGRMRRYAKRANRVVGAKFEAKAHGAPTVCYEWYDHAQECFFVLCD